jgi:hypothetical protein
MRTYERSGVTVDQCTDCRGLFLDRGELEHLIDAEQSWHAGQPPARESSWQEPRYDDRDRGYGDRDRSYGDRDRGYPQQRRRRKSFLDELFD